MMTRMIYVSCTYTYHDIHTGGLSQLIGLCQHGQAQHGLAAGGCHASVHHSSMIDG